MEPRISILAYARKSKKKADGQQPLYFRITIGGRRLEQAIQRSVDGVRWSASSGRMKGTSQEAFVINQHLDTLTEKVHRIERELIQEGKAVNYDNFSYKWHGITEQPKMLLEIFQSHNDKLKELAEIGKDYSPATVERYVTSLEHTRSFIKWKYRVADMDIKKLDFDFISDYEFWLKTRRKCNHNSTMKYLGNFKKIVLLCVKRNWLVRDPFMGYNLTKVEVVREPLTLDELKRLASKIFSTERLNQIRDIFLFSCFTGLAYADVKKLTKSEIRNGVDGKLWIFTSRKKTETPSRIPLLPVALQLIEKYKDHPVCINTDHVLPVPSNQKVNAYLKEIGDICGIQKTLTFHIARHTFATTIALNNGVPIETVAKILGHTLLKTTQHYAKVQDAKVGGDMQLLRNKLSAEFANEDRT